MSGMLTIDATRLLSAVRLIVAGFGSSDDEIDVVATHLVDANLTGHDSHGIGILPRYAGAYQESGLNPNAHVRTLLDAGAMLRLDGGAGFGQVIGRRGDGAGHRTGQAMRLLHRGARQLAPPGSHRRLGGAWRPRRAWCRSTSST